MYIIYNRNIKHWTKRKDKYYRSTEIFSCAVLKLNIQNMWIVSIQAMWYPLWWKISITLSKREINIEIFVIFRFSQARKRSSHFFPPHVSRAQRLAPVRTRTRVAQLAAQCTDHWTTGQSRGVGVPAVQLTTHVKSSTLYGRTSKFFRLDGLLLFFIIMRLRSASSTITFVQLRI